MSQKKVFVSKIKVDKDFINIYDNKDQRTKIVTTPSQSSFFFTPREIKYKKPVTFVNFIFFTSSDNFIVVINLLNESKLFRKRCIITVKAKHRKLLQ